VRTGSSSVAAGEASAPRTYTVERGDTLSEIAQRHYGRARHWRAIFDANRGILDDPDRIHPGQVLTLPELDDDADRAPH
jgi:nucleoid-associated protein YgaU